MVHSVRDQGLGSTRGNAEHGPVLDITGEHMKPNPVKSIKVYCC